MKPVLWIFLIFSSQTSVANFNTGLDIDSAQDSQKQEGVLTVALDDPRTKCESDFAEALEIHGSPVSDGVKIRYIKICMKWQSDYNSWVLKGGGNY